MAAKTVVDFHAVATQNANEIVFNVPDSTTLVPLEERLIDPNTLVITTATGGGGTTLVPGVDYTFSDLNEFATAKAGVDVYQTVNIINATYQGVNLYIQAGTLNQYGDNILAIDINNLLELASAGAGVVGSMEFYAGVTAPSGYLLCDGSFVLIAQYQDLFNVVGHAFNGGVDPADGTFKLPDMRAAGAIGAGTSTQFTQNETKTFGESYDDQMQGQITSGSPVTDGVNGTPRTGDSTHGKQVAANWIIRYAKTTGNDLVLSPPPVYDTGWVANSDWTAVEFVGDYSGVSELVGLSLADLDYKFLVSTDGTDANSWEFMDVHQRVSDNGQVFGVTVYQGTNQLKFRMADNGIRFVASGSFAHDLLTNQSYYYRIVIRKKVWTDLAIIQNVSGVNFEYPKFDISSQNQTLDLSSLENEPNGYRIKAKWSGGDGNFNLSIVIPTGYTLGGVAKATVEADWKGDGQGVIQLVKNGTDLEWEGKGAWDSDGGNWPGECWEKEPSGTIDECLITSPSISPGGSYIWVYPISCASGLTPVVQITSINRGGNSYASGTGAVDKRTNTQTEIEAASANSNSGTVQTTLKGRWTSAYIEVS